MVKNNLIGDTVTIPKLSSMTKNYTGAEIEAVVKSASSFSFNKGSDLMDFTKAAVLKANSKVEMDDFLLALDEIKPQFGIDSDKLEMLIRNDLYDYGDKFRKLFIKIKN